MMGDVLHLAGLLSLALLVLGLCLQDKLPHKRRRASRLGVRGKAALLRAPEHHPQFLTRPPTKKYEQHENSPRSNLKRNSPQSVPPRI